MTTRTYGQACSVANFLDRLGDRWTLLIIRDLLIGPRRFNELLQGLSGIGPNLLSKRLEELQGMGVIEKTAVGGSARHAYELSAKGSELEAVILAMQRWGMTHLQADYEGKRARAELIVVAIRAAFQPQRAASVTAQFELRIDGKTIHALVDEGDLKTGLGPAPEPDLVLITDSQTFNDLAFSQIDPESAQTAGRLRIVGDESTQKAFQSVFSAG